MGKEAKEAQVLSKRWWQHDSTAQRYSALGYQLTARAWLQVYAAPVIGVRVDRRLALVSGETYRLAGQSPEQAGDLHATNFRWT